MRKRNFTRYVGVMLAEESYQKLIRITDEVELPVSEFVRDIIEVELDQFKEKGDGGNGK